MEALRSFLLFGSKKGTLNLDSPSPILNEAGAVLDLLTQDLGDSIITEILELTKNICLPTYVKKNCIFVLALVAKKSKSQKTAYNAFPDICKTSDDLFLFVSYCERVSEKTGWGSAHKKAISKWYNSEEPLDLAVKVTDNVAGKGWCHKDIIQLGHVKPKNAGIYNVL